MKATKQEDTTEIPDENVKIAKTMFIIGCFCLPLIWLFLVVYFFNCRNNKSKNGKIIRKYYDIAFYGVIFWTIVFVGWICLFQFGYKSIPWLNYFHLVYPDGLGWA